LADGFIKWAENVEDLPDPNKFRRRWANQSKEEGIVKSVIKDTTPGAEAPTGAPTALAPGDGRGTLGQKGKAAPSKPPSTLTAASQDSAKRPADGDTEQRPSKAAKPEVSRQVPAPAAKAAGVKRPGDAVVVGGESEPPRRWARRAASTS